MSDFTNINKSINKDNNFIEQTVVEVPKTDYLKMHENEMINNQMMSQSKQKSEGMSEKDDLKMKEENENILGKMIINVQQNMPPVYQQSLPKQLLAEVRLLAEDNGKASEYFAPVVNAAKMIMQKNKPDQEKANAFANLIHSAHYYLNNRPSSILSAQRRRRRRTCERLLDKSVAFINDAPAYYSKALSTKVDSVVKDDPQNREVKQMKDSLSYYMTSKFIESKEAEDKLQKYNSENDNAKIDRVLTVIEGVNSLIGTPMPIHPGEDATEIQKQHYEKEVFDGSMAVMRMYDILIESCDECLRDEEIAEELKGSVRAVKEKNVHTRKVFANSITDYLNGRIPKGSTTWQEALASSGSQIVQLKANDVKEVGRGTSKVYKVKKGDRTLYFKEEEKMEEGPIQIWDKLYENAKSFEEYDESFEERFSEINELMKQGFESLEKAIREHDEENIEYCLSQLYSIFVVELIDYEPENLIQGIQEDAQELYGNDVLKKLGGINPESGFAKFISVVMCDFTKQFNAQRFSSTAAGIKSRRVLSTRNVATSRMAQLMDMSHLVAKSETADVMRGDKRITGTLMEEANGTEARDLYKASNGSSRYTDETMIDMMNMHVFDFICGQVDRNTGNYFLTQDKNKVGNLKMIDNDMAFGQFTGKELSSGRQSFPAMSLYLLISLPKTTKDKIRQMATYPKEYFTLIFSDVLEEDEIDAMMSRVKFLSNALAAAESQLKKNRRKNKESKFLDDMMSDPKFALLYYQHKMYKLSLDAAKNAKPGFDYMDRKQQKALISMYMRSGTYLDPNELPTFEELQRRMDEYRQKWDSKHTKNRSKK